MRSILLLPLAMTVLSAAACRPQRASAEGNQVPELVMETVRFRVDRAGASRALGTAEVVTYRRDTQAVAAKGVTLALRGADGDAEVTAPAVFGLVGERRFDAAGGLVAFRGADKAATDAARYEPVEGGQPGLVRGGGPVRVTGPGYRLTGTGFTLDPVTRVLTLTRGAHLVSGLPEGR
jgi:hypothetical protein